MDQGKVDFALSYAGEDSELAQALSGRLRELSFSVFMADEQRRRLVGTDAEVFFDQLFSEARQVVTLISKHYRVKEWPRYEWDVIRRRDVENRYIPIRLDNTPILGLSSNILYASWTGDNLDELVSTCVERLLLFERTINIKRPTLYEQLVEELRHNSRGSLAKAYQLVVDQRERTPLDDASMPESRWTPRYSIAQAEWSNYSRVSRRSVKVRLPGQISEDEVIFNLKHCCVLEFNSYKPDAVMVFGYSDDADLDGAADLAVVEFAPFGDWGRAEEGVAYNLPTTEFDFSVRKMRRGRP